MSRTLTQDLHQQFQRTAGMVRGVIQEFDEDQWRAGISWFLIPARLSLHLIESLEVYFTPKSDYEDKGRFPFGRGYGDVPWWEIPDEKLPSQEDILAYLGEIEDLIAKTFDSLDDTAMSAAFTDLDFSGQTLAGHYAYALRHTMHHQGQLSALAIHHGHSGGDWE